MTHYSIFQNLPWKDKSYQLKQCVYDLEVNCPFRNPPPIYLKYMHLASAKYLCCVYKLVQLRLSISNVLRYVSIKLYITVYESSDLPF